MGVVCQGDVFWADFGRATGSEPGGRRPALVVQSDAYNRSAVRTSVVVSLTTNLMLSAAPGNVRLRKGEAGLPRASVVNITQLRTVDKSDLRERIGRLTHTRLREVLGNLAGLFAPGPDGGPPQAGEPEAAPSAAEGGGAAHAAEAPGRYRARRTRRRRKIR